MPTKKTKTETKAAVNVFEDLRLKANLSRPRMATLLNTNQQQVYKLERRNSKVTTEWLQKYALALNIPIEDIMRNKETINLDSVRVNISDVRSVPVYGMAAAGDPELVAINDGSIVKHVAFPVLEGMSLPEDAFGVQVLGESMLPRYKPNEIVIVNPHVRPLRNEECVLEMHDGTAAVKIYQQQFGDKYIVSQHNDAVLPDGAENRFEFEIRRVKRLCAIIGTLKG